MITPQNIKHLFQSAVRSVTAHIQDFSVHPEKDFSRARKLPPDKLITFLVAEGSSSTRVELLDFFGFDPNAPTSSAFRQQRAKLRPEAIKETMDIFSRRTKPINTYKNSQNVNAKFHIFYYNEVSDRLFFHDKEGTVWKGQKIPAFGAKYSAVSRKLSV